MRELLETTSIVVVLAVLPGHPAFADGVSPLTGAAEPAATFPGVEWQHGEPSAFGFDRDGLQSAIDFAQRSGSTSGMVICHGIVMSEWGDVTHRSNLHSARKSFVSALVGIAVARGQIHLDDTLEKLGIDDNQPALSSEEKQATVRMLLEARSGVYHPTVYETSGMLADKPPRYTHAPGTFWYYNNFDFNVIGAIYRQASGNDIFAALKSEIAEPIGMQDYRVQDGHYVSDPATRYPAYPFDLSARDLARFGLLYLHGGKWQERQVVPREWVEESTRSYSDTPTGGYGYMWWSNVPTRGTNPTKPMFWADGHLGQYAVVVPSLDLVVVNLVGGKKTIRQMHQRDMLELVRQIEAAGGETN